MINSILAMAACVIMSGYFSATETAFSSVNKTRLKAMAESGSERAKLALKLSENYDRLISTILIGNNIVNIAVASIGTILFVQMLGEELGALVSTVVVTVVVLIFGEITPKSLAKDYPEKFTIFSAPILKWIIWVFSPLNFIFSQWKKLVGRLFHSEENIKMSQDELLILLDEVQQEGAIDEEGGQLLKNAVEFGELQVEDILTPRVNLAGVNIDSTKEQTADIFKTTNFSRLPVYRENLDNIVGILNHKEFYTEEGITDNSISEIMTPPFFIHKTEKISVLLKKMKQEKAHIAIVVDEFGGTLGIVTMEDILEELVGEIWDEHDEVEEFIKKTGENTFTVDGNTALDDFCEKFLISTSSDCISVGGWITEVMDKIPDEGQSFFYNNLSIKVTEVKNQHVEKAVVEVMHEE